LFEKVSSGVIPEIQGHDVLSFANTESNSHAVDISISKYGAVSGTDKQGVSTTLIGQVQ
jgi:hypothetical protein